MRKKFSLWTIPKHAKAVRAVFAVAVGVCAHIPPALADGDTATSIQCHSPEDRPTLLPLLSQEFSPEANAQKQLKAAVLAILGQDSAAATLYDSQSAPPSREADPAVPESASNAVPALDAIVEAAADRRVVMLNEAHHLSGHRLFARFVMRRLAAAGFDVFAAEALPPTRTDDLLERGYPAVGDGLYLTDPEYGLLVREALRLGLSVEAYEQRDEQEPQCEQACASTVRVNAREAAQAQNLADLMRKNPDARLFVYAGFDHIVETPEHRNGEKIERMASRLKRLTGIDPLTIDQVGGTLRTSERLSDPVALRFAKTARPGFAGPAVWRDLDGKAIVSARYAGRIDMSVFHRSPGANPSQGSWFSQDRTPFRIERTALPKDRPILLKAFYRDEGCNAVPVDQALLEEMSGEIRLMLPAGRFAIEYETRSAAGRLETVEID